MRCTALLAFVLIGCFTRFVLYFHYQYNIVIPAMWYVKIASMGKSRTHRQPRISFVRSIWILLPDLTIRFSSAGIIVSDM